MKHLYLTLCAILFSFASFALTPVTGPDSVCTGATITLMDATAGGVWTSGSTAVAAIDPATGICTGIGAGTALISYTVSGATELYTIKVNSAPGPITGTTGVCSYSISMLTDATPGGMWTSTDTFVAYIFAATGYTAGIKPGTATIAYRIPNGCVATTTFQVDSMPATISGKAYVCTDSAITLFDASPGGIWSNTSAFGSISSAGVLTGIAPGVDTIRYTLPGSVCPSIVYVTVSAPPPAITGSSSLCTETFIALSDAVPGGEWHTNDTAIVYTGTYTGSIFGKAAGTATITYSLYTGCTVSTLLTVLSSPSAISGISSACVGATSLLSDVSAGSWSSSDISIAAIGSATGIVTGLAGGTAIITYQSASGCFAKDTFTVNTVPAPATISSLVATVCPGDSFILYTDVTGGAWSAGNANASVSSSGVVTGISPGVDSISYTLTNVCGATSSFFTVTVGTVPVPATITSATDSVCPGSSVTLNADIAGGIWSGSNAYAAVSPPSGAVLGIAPGIDTISYNITNACGTATTSFTVTVLSWSDCHPLQATQSAAAPAQVLQVYPNPADGAFTINVLSDKDNVTKIVITNVVGEIVKELTTRSNKQLDITLAQPKGMYFITAITAAGSSAEKVMIR